MKEEITVSELRSIPPEKVMLIDVRDESAFALGHIDNAVNIAPDAVPGMEFPTDKDIVVCCRSGIISEEIAEGLR